MEAHLRGVPVVALGLTLLAGRSELKLRSCLPERRVAILRCKYIVNVCPASSFGVWETHLLVTCLISELSSI